MSDKVNKDKRDSHDVDRSLRNELPPLSRIFKRSKACPGCRGDDSFKSKACIACRIKNCEKIVNGEVKYCFSCDGFPCARLNHLDKRYRTKYGMSMIDNLENIRQFGIRHFIRNEKERWTCPQCGEMICVHNPQCLLANTNGVSNAGEAQRYRTAGYAYLGRPPVRKIKKYPTSFFSGKITKY